MNQICPHCQADNPPDNTVCHRCDGKLKLVTFIADSDLPYTRKCPKCGQEMGERVTLRETIFGTMKQVVNYCPRHGTC